MKPGQFQAWTDMLIGCSQLPNFLYFNILTNLTDFMVDITPQQPNFITFTENILGCFNVLSCWKIKLVNYLGLYIKLNQNDAHKCHLLMFLGAQSRNHAKTNNVYTFMYYAFLLFTSTYAMQWWKTTYHLHWKWWQKLCIHIIFHQFFTIDRLSAYHQRCQ